MSLYVALTVSTLLLVASVVVLRARVDVGLVLFAQLTLMVFGLLTMYSEGSIPPGVVVAFTSGAACFFVGYALSTRGYPARVAPPSMRPLADSTVWALVTVTAVLTAYHFSVAGIPILTTDIEKARFDFSSSGLFGLPGRAYLYGTKIVWVLASVNATAHGLAWRSSRPWQAATAVAVGAALLSGFKGQLLTLVVMGCLAYTFAHPDRPLRLGRLVVRYAWMPAIAMAYFFYAASKYRTYDVSGVGGVSLLTERLTGVAAEPAAVGLLLAGGTAHPGVLVSDAAYFVTKYAGGDVEGRYTLERAVSAEMTGVSPSSSAWTVPTTVGGISEAIYAFGSSWGLVVLLLVGLVLGRLQVARRTSVLGDCARFVSVFAAYTWVMKGGLAYTAINWAAMVAFVLCLAVALEHLGRRPRAVHHTSRRPSARAGAVTRATVRSGDREPVAV